MLAHGRIELVQLAFVASPISMMCGRSERTRSARIVRRE
jgi:hypothetical protein